METPPLFTRNSDLLLSRHFWKKYPRFLASTLKQCWESASCWITNAFLPFPFSLRIWSMRRRLDKYLVDHLFEKFLSSLGEKIGTSEILLARSHQSFELPAFTWIEKFTFKNFLLEFRDTILFFATPDNEFRSKLQRSVSSSLFYRRKSIFSLGSKIVFLISLKQFAWTKPEENNFSSPIQSFSILSRKQSTDSAGKRIASKFDAQ